MDVNIVIKISARETKNSVESCQSTNAISRYLKMVENRYMSLLSTFSDREIQQGLDELKNKYSQRSMLQFNDRFVFITGKKND